MEAVELHLKNFRGYKDAVLRFEDKINLIVGVNGSGKTSALDSLALLFSWLNNRTLNERSNGQYLDDLDIKNKSRGASVSIKVKHANDFYSWTVGKSVRGHSTGEYKSDFSDLSKLAKLFQANLDEDPDLASLPLVVYYPVDRAIVDIPIRIRGKHQFNQLSAYEDSLKSAANFRRFFEWFRAQQEVTRSFTMDSIIAHLKSGGTLESLDDLPYDAAAQQLDVVCRAIYRFMPGFSNLRVMYRPLRMMIEKGETNLNLLQLSGGEKIMLALVGDLARRLSHANPQMENPLEGEAIVLIDEIDLHLHPKWQRNAIERLAEVFPNCQFIVTSHSPHIVTHVPPSSVSVVSMDYNGEVLLHSVKNAYGYSAERLLEDVMGLETTRPSNIQEKLDLVFELISEARLDEAEVEISFLKRHIPEDGDLIRASALVARKRVIGK
ncbi:AAA family ATPase [Rhodobacteraceae bacterium R_SAG6]|nr:AAA family ATPase [Rhodobacteraceae bacterium R_SAG6]